MTLWKWSGSGEQGSRRARTHPRWAPSDEKKLCLNVRVSCLPVTICHKRKHASSLFSSCCSLRLLSLALVSGRGGRRPERTQRPATSLDRHVR